MLTSQVTAIIYTYKCYFIIILYRAIGFSGPPADSVHHALSYLKHLVVYDKLPLINGIEPGMCEFVRPCLELPDVFELLHHTNQVSHVFIKDAIIGKHNVLVHQLIRFS